MEQDEKARSNRLLWISTAIFSLEAILIIGYNWLFDEYLGNASLTISRYVGLNAWSIFTFCALNISICVMLVCYLITNAGIRSFIWRFLMYGFVLTFMALSIAPHLPEDCASSDIHRFFAGAMFAIMSLIGIVTVAITRSRGILVFGTLFIVYGIFFIFCDLLRIDFFMQNILWFETAYLFSFFGLLLSSNRLKAA